jgi:hypothetical protein
MSIAPERTPKPVNPELAAARERKSKLWHEGRPVRYVDPSGIERYFEDEQVRDKYIARAKARKSQQERSEQPARMKRRRIKRFSAVESHPLLKVG